MLEDVGRKGGRRELERWEDGRYTHISAPLAAYFSASFISLFQQVVEGEGGV